jgi:hypothetical protein
MTAPDYSRKDDMLLSDHITDEMQRYAVIEARLDTIETHLGALVDIWTQAKGAVKFIKVCAGIVATAAAIWAFVTSHFHITVK